MKRLGASLVCALSSVVLTACGPEQKPSAPGNPSPAVATSSTSPLPAAAYKAEIAPVNPPKTLRVGEQASIKVKVKNIGNGTWPAQGQGPKYKVDLGNHWLDKQGVEVVADDGRIGLPHDLKPGEEAELLLTVKAPKTPGDYVLELDMVHEDITWFKRHGSQTVKTSITVQ
jgi:hypothetical protein